MDKPPFKSPAKRMSTSVGSGKGGSGNARPPHSGPTRMSTSVGKGKGGSGNSRPPKAGPTRMDRCC